MNWEERYSTCSRCPDPIEYEVVIEGLTSIKVSHPPCEISGLTPGAQYLVYVYAIAADNNVSRRCTYHLNKFIPVIPTKPGTPEVSDLTCTSATLTWAPSTDNGGNIRYRVYLDGHLVGQTDQPTFKLSHLRTSVSYLVEVVAFNEGGISQSASVTFRTLLRPPTNLKLKHNAGTCRLSWSPMFFKFPAHKVTINGKKFTAGFLGLNFSLAEVSPGPAPHHFTFEVYAELDGQVSETTEFETTLYDVEPPSRPGKPVITNITDSTAHMEWAPSSDNGGFVQYRVVLNGLVKLDYQETQYQLTNMQSGINQLVFVRAEDKDGNLSQHSEPIIFKTTGPEHSGEVPFHSARVLPLTSTSAQIQWFYDPIVFVLGATILINGDVHAVAALVGFSNVQGLIPGFTYTIELFPFGSPFKHGPMTVIYEAKDITPPTVPENLSITEMTPDSVTLSWDESTDDIGVHEYVIYNNSVYFDSTPLTQYTAVDLVPDTYSFEVRAVDFSGNASEPASIPIEIKGTPFSAPTNILVSRGLMPAISWDAPSDMEDVIRYDIVLTGPGREELSFQTTRNFLRLEKQALNRYEIRITALNAKGRSAPLISEFTR
ncbi:fibronectin type III domain-containing protein [Pseudomonas sp. QTF5]|uniref:fibronectin type III domain-containing protein n=1 Tax=Pseudomonas sp. QTF5 TaxID=1435425 RepID=UPI003531D92F